MEAMEVWKLFRACRISYLVKCKSVRCANLHAFLGPLDGHGGADEIEAAIDVCELRLACTRTRDLLVDCAEGSNMSGGSPRSTCDFIQPQLTALELMSIMASACAVHTVVLQIELTINMFKQLWAGSEVSQSKVTRCCDRRVLKQAFR